MNEFASFEDQSVIKGFDKIFNGVSKKYHYHSPLNKFLFLI